MDLRFSPEDEAFRTEIRTFLEEALNSDFAAVRGRGGPGDDDCLFDERLAWERHLGAHGWTCVAWPAEYGGRGLTLHQQVVYFEEYARARAPGRIGHIGETLLGPTLIAFGTEAQRQRFLPGIVAGTELWCQGYSEPGAGSDLANIQTRAHIADGQWVIDGQKVWTSQAHWADWCFVLARTNGGVAKHKGISYLLVPMHQDGIETRPIHQLTGDSEFNEVFFTGATTEADHVVGAIDDGWRVAMGTLAYERGASTLGQNLMFLNEWDEVLALAQHNGRVADPVIRQRLLDTWIRLRLMRLNAMRIMSSAHEAPPAAMITKLFWATLHRDLGELAMDVVGPHAMIRTGDDADFSRLQRLFLFSRSDTIYAGSNQIQRNIIGERALGLPKEPSR
ncbi:MAG: acyl-CoA dehydrogenase [Acidimicrobiia bacterium]|jgi:alkylation response protein AidB-like acyl-CoA dehydrogenase|nr:acyl-CoA dehydrogenase [Acidimicrobiia bacterium]